MSGPVGCGRDDDCADCLDARAWSRDRSEPTRKVYSESEVEELVDHAQGSSYMLGISSGWEQAGAWMREKAAEFFKKGDDDVAQRLRLLADDLLETSKERRKDYDEREAAMERESEYPLQ